MIKTKDRRQKIGNKKQRTEDRRINRINNILLSIICLLSTVFWGMANASEVIKGSGAYQITGIEAMDNLVKIRVNGPIKYRIIKPDDPFRVVVDIENAVLGNSKEKISSDKSVVTEITLSQIQDPLTARLNILLNSPYIARPEILDNTLVVHFESADMANKDKTISLVSVDTKDTSDDEDVAMEITEVVFNKTDKGAEIIIKADGLIGIPSVYELGKRLMIDIPDVTVTASIPKVSDPVKAIGYKTEKEKTRFVLEMEREGDTKVFSMDDELIVSIMSKQQPVVKTQNAEVRGQKTGLDTQNSGLVSMDFQDADITPIFRLLGEVGGYNIIVHPDVKGKITMKLMNVHWQQALDVILKTFALEKVQENNIIRVIPRKIYEDEVKAAMAVESAKEEANIETKVFVVNYADVEQVKESIEKAGIVKKENISIDKRTRSIIVKDTPSRIQEASKLISTLDKTTHQILIEARVVEMNTSFIRDIGVQWGLMWLSSNWRDSILGSASSTPVTGGQFPMAVNLPATDLTSAITFGYLNASQTFGLDLRLSAAESVGKAKIISSPKIMTIENEKAEITHGTQIPVITPGTANEPPKVTYKDANLKLVVTPATTPDGQVFLNIEITNDEADFDPKRAILGNVPINKREAKSKVFVKDGETIVIGGILKSREDEGERSVPGLSKIPILGWLFKNERKNIETQELLVFITPRIVKQ